MNIDWEKYYEKDSEVIDLSPERNPSELQRCLAAWSVFPKKKFASLLDVGCGDGYFCYWIYERCKIDRVEGIDISESRVKRARSRYSEITYARGHLPNLPYRNDEFEIVTCIEVIEHQKDPVAALRELKRVSSRYIIVTVPDQEVIKKVLCPHCLKEFPADGHLHSFDNNLMAQIAAEAGLDLLEMHSYYPPMGASTGIFPPRLGRLLRKMELLIMPRPGSYIASLMVKTDNNLL